jgi:MOSC domain-containing protein YiiM
MVEEMPSLKALMSRHAGTGRLQWIGLRSGHREAVVRVDRVQALAGRGLLGDHRSGRSGRNKRQVTLIQAEHLPAIAALCHREAVPPEWLRRNLVVGGISLLALKDGEFSIGGARLRGSGLCHPCSRMEQTLGPGGYNAVRGHGGITAEVLEAGFIAVGDAVLALSAVGITDLSQIAGIPEAD